MEKAIMSTLQGIVSLPMRNSLYGVHIVTRLSVQDWILVLGWVTSEKEAHVKLAERRIRRFRYVQNILALLDFIVKESESDYGCDER